MSDTDRRDFLKQSAAVGLTIGGGIYFSGLASPAPAGFTPLRPPGALDEGDFASTCIRCMRCVDACPNHCLESLPGSAGELAGTPTMHPRRAACMLCSSVDSEFLRCTEVCPSGALRPVKKEKKDIQEKVAIGVAEIDFDLCYSYNHWSCGACFRACPLAGEAMTVTTWERPVIHPEACIGCGCCERACIRYPHAVRVKARTT